MRNLKRALSLALAAAMLISLMVVGASAAENYGDADAVSQTEAVEVLTAIGVVGGDQNGNFNPTATLTRAEFCVMIANALTGGTFDPALFDGTNTPFTDVAGHWGANYIAYCYSVGVIAGTSATTFGPDNTLTAAQASAILLSALGYNQNGEFAQNGQFELNVTRWAQQAGLYDQLSVSATAGISRESTAKLIFNALTNTTPVGYNTLSNAYYSIGSNVLSGIVYSGKDLDPAVPVTASEPYAGTLGYTNFELTQTSGAPSDVFERPSVRWQHPVNGVQTIIGTYPDDVVVTYTKAVSEADLYDALGLTGSTKTISVYEDGAAAGDGSVTVTPEGGSATPVAEGYTLNAADTTTKLGGNGALLQAFVDSTNNDVTVTIVHTYIGEVVSVANATANKDRTITIAGRNHVAGTFETDDFNREDVVLFTYSEKAGDTGVQSVALADKVTGVLNSYTTGKSLTVGGTSYEYAADRVTVADGGDLDKDVDVYLDQYGYAIDVEGVNTSTEYAFVLKTGTGTYENDYKAQLLLSDGTVVDADVTGPTTGQVNHLVSYTVNSNDKYTLTTLSNTNAELQGIATSDGDFKITKGSSSVSLDSSVTVNANGKTVFLVVTGTANEPVYTAYTGIANVPTITVEAPSTGTTANVYATDAESGETAEIIYVDTRVGGVVNANADNVVYILGDDKVTQTTDSTGSYYVFDAIVDGNITTVKVDATVAVDEGLSTGSSELYDSVNTNVDGIITGVVALSGTANGTGTVKDANGTLGLGSGYYAYTADCAVFYVDKDGNISVYSVSAIGDDSTNTVWFARNNDGQVSTIVIEEVNEDSTDFDVTVTAGSKSAKVENATWTGTGTAASPKTGTATITGATAGDRVQITKDTDMASVSIVDGTEPTTVPAGGAGTSDVTYQVTSEDGTETMYYKLTITFTAS